MTTNNPVTDRAREAAADLIETYWAGSDAAMLKLAQSYRDGHTQGVWARAFQRVIDETERDILAGQSVGDYETLRGEAVFLVDRLREYERDLTAESAEGWGHVEPSLARIEMILDAAPSAPASDSSAIPEGRQIDCPSCDGEGAIEHPHMPLHTLQSEAPEYAIVDCEDCSGTGKVWIESAEEKTDDPWWEIQRGVNYLSEAHKLKDRAQVAAEYRLSASPHEWTDEDSLAMAKFRYYVANAPRRLRMRKLALTCAIVCGMASGAALGRDRQPATSFVQRQSNAVMGVAKLEPHFAPFHAIKDCGGVIWLRNVGECRQVPIVGADNLVFRKDRDEDRPRTRPFFYMVDLKPAALRGVGKQYGMTGGRIGFGRFDTRNEIIALRLGKGDEAIGPDVQSRRCAIISDYDICPKLQSVGLNPENGVLASFKAHPCAVALSGNLVSFSRLAQGQDNQNNTGKRQSGADTGDDVAPPCVIRCFFSGDGGAPLSAQIGAVVIFGVVAAIGIFIGISGIVDGKRWRWLYLVGGVGLLASLIWWASPC